MGAELLLAPVGAGKTEQALATISRVADDKPFAKVWVLLATERQINEFRKRLIEHNAARQVVFNVEFFTFYDLYNRILDAAGQPTRQLGEAARIRLLRVLAKRLVQDGRLDVYQKIASKAGFVRTLADFFYELKQDIIEPEQFFAVTQQIFGERQKDKELAALYDEYQSRLREHDIVDREGQGWLALAQLRQDKMLHRDVDLVVVDGYDQFTPLQAQMLAYLSERVGETLVTLTDVPAREETVGRRFKEARTTLQETYRNLEVELNIRQSSGQIELRHPDLQHLAENIFRLDGTATASSGGIQFLTAPDAITETESVLRHVKHLLLYDDGISPDDMIIVLRDYERYHVHIRNIGRSYNLPLALHLGQSLAQTPPVQALMSLITLHDPTSNLVNFLRRPLLDALRSPYFRAGQLSAADVDLLDRIGSEFAVVGGREAWLDAIELAVGQRAQAEDDNTAKPPLIDHDKQQHLHEQLTTFFDAVTPSTQATIAQYVEWIEQLIGRDPVRSPDEAETDNPRGVLNMVTHLRRDAPAHIVSRDLAALNQFKVVLQTLLSAQELLTTLENTGETITWLDFLADLRTSIERESIESHPPREGRVLVTTATDARGLPHKHVFVMGLSEGVFPLRLAEDPLYLDNERIKLQQAGLPIETLSERAADDGLFYELISLATDQLMLSRPSVQDGAPWVESHLWRETTAVYADAETLISANERRIGQIVDILQAATFGEVAVAVADGLKASEISQEHIAAYNWLLKNNPAAWSNIHSGRSIEYKRMSTLPHDRYTGLIQTPQLIDRLKTNILSVKHSWSASQLNDYGACPFRFFAGRVLYLEALQEPQLGMNARQLGSLNHSILEETYTQLAQAGVEIAAANLDFALQILEEVGLKQLAVAPQQLGFRASPIWQQEQDVLMTRLQALVTYDFTEMNAKLAKQYGAQPRKPYIMEAKFGIGDGYGILLDTGTGIPPVTIGGYIDRIDRYGDNAIVLDYKTGSSKISLDELKIGRNFQIMLYILAAQGILDSKQNNEPDAPQQVLGGFFWHIRDRKTSGVLVTADPEHMTLLNNARTMIGHYVQQAQAGHFTVDPSKPDSDGHCTTYCEFYKLCRVAVTHADKLRTAL